MTRTSEPCTSESPMDEVLAQPLDALLPTTAGPRDGRRLAVRVVGRTWHTEVTLGSPWRQPDGTWRRLTVVVLDGDRRPSRHLPRITGEIGGRGDADRVTGVVDRPARGSRPARWLARRIGRVVVATLDAGATGTAAASVETSAAGRPVSGRRPAPHSKMVLSRRVPSSARS